MKITKEREKKNESNEPFAFNSKLCSCLWLSAGFSPHTIFFFASSQLLLCVYLVWSFFCCVFQMIDFWFVEKPHKIGNKRTHTHTHIPNGWKSFNYNWNREQKRTHIEQILLYVQCYFFISSSLDFDVRVRFIFTLKKKIISQLDWPHARFCVCWIEHLKTSIDAACKWRNRSLPSKTHFQSKHLTFGQPIVIHTHTQYPYRYILIEHSPNGWFAWWWNNQIYTQYLSLSIPIETISTHFATIYKFKLNALKCNNHSIMLIP